MSWAKIHIHWLICMTFLIVSASSGESFAQVVTSIPEFATENDSVIVIFNAEEGDRGLAGFSGQVYAHTGVITDQSVSSTDWKYVIGNWGDNSVQPQLTNLGDNLWELKIGRIREFYGIPANEKVLRLAFVFRSADTQRTGRDVAGADIFLTLFDPGLTIVVARPAVAVSFGDPLRSPAFASLGDTLEIVTTAAAIGTQLSTLALSVDNIQVAETNEDSLEFDFVAQNFSVGPRQVFASAIDTAGVATSDSFIIMINPLVNESEAPQGIVDGINLTGNNSVTLSLFAPFKEFVYVLGDFNDWKVDTQFFMNREEFRPDSVRFWLEIDSLDPNEEYGFQYLVDGELRIADPYAEKILSPDDRFIGNSTFPNLKSYPNETTNRNVSTFRLNADEYQWQATGYERPPQSELVIYELLVRDFIAAHNYDTLVDTLDYLERLGINAIELMPVTEFEGNISWGYNPAFYFASDKYYGTKNALKRFIDECHKRGIAVILDAVLNHSFGQSSFVRLYNEGAYGPPTPENPWYNVEPRHPFNVGYDFNHESSNTKALVDRINAYWLTEYRVDGFRFDLSKGFTQRFSTNDGQFRLFDQSRVNILKRMADKIWSVDATAYVILEHFAENSEEIELSNYGMMLWGNMNIAYSQSAMGWLTDPLRSSDLAPVYYKNRGWSKSGLIGYMESHDEPWLMYKNLQFGRASSDGSYDVQDLETALDRIKLAAAFFFTIPGPKMMWQFGELGYDRDLPEGGLSGRTDPKPILWQYFQHEGRNRLYRTIAALIDLRNQHEVFRSTETEVRMRVGQGQFDRRLQLSHESMNVTIIGNFDVEPLSIAPNFQHAGKWYNFFAGDSIVVVNPNASIALHAGEFHIFTDKRVARPDGDLITSVESSETDLLPSTFALRQNYPNPFNPATTLRFELPQSAKVAIEIFNLRGQRVRALLSDSRPAGVFTVSWDGLDDRGKEASSGVYVARLQAESNANTKSVHSIKLIKMK